MNGTLLESLPSASRIRGNGDFSFTVKVLSSTTCISPIASISFWPSVSRLPQRSMEAMQSAARTGCPSCHFKPSRKREFVDEPVVADRPAVDHLRLRLEIL